MIAVGLAVLFWLPAPLHTDAEGIVWLPDDAVVRAGTDGFIHEVRAVSGTVVTRGQTVVESIDPELTTRVTVLRARETELTAKLDAVRFSDRVEAVVTETELSAVRTERAREEHRAALLTARAGADGVFVMPSAADMPGRFVKRGDILGYTLPRDGARIVRATVSQEDIDLVRHNARQARIKLADHMDQGIAVRSIREVPAGKDQLPGSALGSGGGGATMVDPRDEHGLTALNRVFQIDLELSEPVPEAGYRGRAHVRFDHAWEPIGDQLWRRMRQLLLSRVEI
jgi:putative peptide zinc metalloprotease protein